jgi:hypothetical protein
VKGVSQRRFRFHHGQKGAALMVRVTPRARRTELAGFREDGTVRVRVQAPPTEGKANRALLELLARILGVRKNRIEIIAGHSGLDKIVSVLGLSPREAQGRLHAWMEAQVGEE